MDLHGKILKVDQMAKASNRHPRAATSPNAGIAICKLEITATVMCYGTRESLEGIHRNSPDILHIKGVPLTVTVHDGDDNSVLHENHQIARMDYEIVDTDWPLLRIGYPTDEDAEQALEIAMWSIDPDDEWLQGVIEEFKANCGGDHLLATGLWSTIEWQRRMSSDLFSGSLSKASTFPRIPDFEPTETDKLFRIVTRLFLEFQRAGFSLNDDVERADWENQLAYYFLRYPSLKTRFHEIGVRFPTGRPRHHSGDSTGSD